jgi:hypothetical protein
MSLAFAAGVVLACSSTGGDNAPLAGTGSDDCTVGSEACPCTPGGGCDPGLSCYSGVCVDAGATSGNGDGAEGPGPGGGTDGVDETSAADDDDDGADAPKLDVYAPTDVPLDTCEQAVDVVFTMDVSTSMTFFFDALLEDMADVDAALAALGADPRYGLVVFVDDYAVVDGGLAFEDVEALQAEFQTWKSFTTSFSEPQINGGTNTTWPENSLDALWHAASSFQWRPAKSTLRLVIHATDDTFSEAPAVLDGIAVEHTYGEAIEALQTEKVRVAAFASQVGGSLFDPANVEAGWFSEWGAEPSIPDSTGGVVFLIDGILDGTLSLGDAIVQTVEAVECTPYPEG